MATEIVASKPQAVAPTLSAGEIRAQVNLIQEVMQAVMQKGQHYGVIPGCGDKPSLFKPGAEKLMSTFRLSAEPIVEDLSGPDEMRFRVTVRICSQLSGQFLGAGIGEASSNEEKYKWRRAYSANEFDKAPEDRRRVKYGKYEDKQVRTNPADVANTVLKMAKKRALVDGVLTVTAASDIFTQDIEDLPAEIVAREAQRTPPEMPREKAKAAPAESNNAIISDDQRRVLFAKAKAAYGADYETKLRHLLTARHGSDSTKLSQSQFDDVTEWMDQLAAEHAPAEA